jgi:hypothetical protein
VDLKDGVSCGGCHGPSDDWLGRHFAPETKVKVDDKEVSMNWKDLTPAQKHSFGFRDLRDPLVRSTLCLSCHVGNASQGKVVTHAMFAAGHPPLPPIEIATFSQNEPPHWRNSRDVPYFKNPNEKKTLDYHLQDVQYQQTKLALVGVVASFRESVRLAHDRATFNANDPATVWPELIQGKEAKDPKPMNGEALRSELQQRWPALALAHSDCYACHHELDSPGFRQVRGFGYQLSTEKLKQVVPGRVLVRIWPTTMLEAAVLFANKPDRLKELRTHLDALTAIYQNRPFAKPEELAKVTENLIKWSDEVIREVNATPCTEAKVRELIQRLGDYYGDNGTKKPRLIPDFEAARLIASVIKVAAGELQLNGKASGFEPELQKLVEELDIVPYLKRKDRINITLDILSTPDKPDELKDRAKFTHFLELLQQLDHPGHDPQAFATALKDLSTNTFLTRVRSVEIEEFNKGFKAKASILQELGDKEQKELFKALDSYDPAEFRKNLQAVVARLTK